jgi:hypothetical protein
VAALPCCRVAAQQATDGRPAPVTMSGLPACTGAQASPLQCVPLADSCLALGAQVRPLRRPHIAPLKITQMPSSPLRPAQHTAVPCRCHPGAVLHVVRVTRVLVAMQSCRRAIEMLNTAFKDGVFSARDARVIYGQTDSLFVSFPSSSVRTLPSVACQAEH